MPFSSAHQLLTLIALPLTAMAVTLLATQLRGTPDDMPREPTFEPGSAARQPDQQPTAYREDPDRWTLPPA